jgi:hypothetical protein
MLVHELNLEKLSERRKWQYGGFLEEALCVGIVLTVMYNANQHFLFDIKLVYNTRRSTTPDMNSIN